MHCLPTVIVSFGILVLAKVWSCILFQLTKGLKKSRPTNKCCGNKKNEKTILEQAKSIQKNKTKQHNAKQTQITQNSKTTQRKTTIKTIRATEKGINTTKT